MYTSTYAFNHFLKKIDDHIYMYTAIVIYYVVVLSSSDSSEEENFYQEQSPELEEFVPESPSSLSLVIPMIEIQSVG